MKKIQTLISLGVLLALLTTLIGPSLQVAQAAALTAKSDTMSSLRTNTLANHDIRFTSPTGVASGATIIITFPADFSIPVALDFEDMDVLDDGVNVVLAATPAGATWGAVRTSATVITLTNGTTVVAAGSLIRILIGTNAVSVVTGIERITNPTSTGQKTISMSGTFGDTGDIVVNILTNDQVAATATVAESLSFSINDIAIGFGTLSSSAARFANGAATGSTTEVEAHTIIVGTNGASGYTLTVNGSTLTSGANTITAIGASNTASSVGTEQYGIRATVTGGTNPVVAVPYAAAGFALDTAAFPDQLASDVGASTDATYSIRYIANIASATEAGSYTSTLTYTATATF